MSDSRLSKDLLLELLQDSEVQMSIRKILNLPKIHTHAHEESSVEANVRSTQEQCSGEQMMEHQTLENQLKESEAMIQKLKQLLGLEKVEKEDLQKKNSQQVTQLEYLVNEKASYETKVTEMREALAFYQTHFKHLQNLHTLYLDLSQETKTSLQGIFPESEAIDGFIACGVQERRIEQLWEYLKNEIIEDKNSDIEMLLKLFDGFFALFLKAFPNYAKSEVKRGEKFDVHRHINDGKIDNVTGTIKEVRLLGWYSQKNGKVIKQSIVTL